MDHIWSTVRGYLPYIAVIVIGGSLPYIWKIVLGGSSGKAEDPKDDENEASFRVFSLDELNQATNDFSLERMVGEGSDGQVFRAVFRNGKMSAVKKLNSGSSPDSDADFVSQLNKVSELKHEHITELLGYCLEQNNRILVCQFATMGSLHNVLHDKELVLTWAQRVQIACGVAKGLEYLHQKVQPPIVHGNVTSSNVLLFNGFVSKIADLSITSALLNTEAPAYDARTFHSSSITRVRHLARGHGYGSPERIALQNDIYGFGVVLLELLTGREPVDQTLSEEEQDLVTWAAPYLKEDQVKQCVDPKLNDNYPLRAAAKIAALAEMCIQEEPDFRPNMTIMVRSLEPLLSV